MKHFLIAVTLIASVSCQYHTQKGPDGYKYPQPESRFDLPAVEVAQQELEHIEEPQQFDQPEPSCANGGAGSFCCLNGAENVDCCDNGGAGPYCCTNGVNNPTCSAAGPPPLPSFVPVPSLPKVIPRVEAPVIEEQTMIYIPPQQAEPQGLPPLPSFVPLGDFPKVKPAPVKPAPFAQPSLPVKPQVQSVPRFEPQEQPQAQSFTGDEYLPPQLDVRSAAAQAPDWEAWKSKYNKNYGSPEEDRKRRAIFEKNVNEIFLHNEDFDSGLFGFDNEANKFCDLLHDEFMSLHTGIRGKRMSGGSGGGSSGSGSGQSMNNVFMPSPMLDAQVEDEVDWRDKGAVTPVKNQGKCASCWAFAANGALEAQNFLKNGKLVSLSEQNLIDCVTENDGCDGGYMTNAYEYVIKNPGVDTEASYPYEEKQSTCRFDPANVGSECIAYMEIQIGNEEALKQAVATVGPVAAGIDGAQRSFQFYKSGYYFEPKCDTEVNHAVVIVGYGTTESGEDYWLCKNSWDTDWGEEGYIRMARNKNNHCGITTLASYPLV